MAEVTGVGGWVAKGVYQIVWANMANGDYGSAFACPHLADKTVTVRGTFGVGGSVSIRGTDYSDATAATSWDILNDTRGEGNAATFTARDTRTLNENPARMLPHVTAGDGNTSLTVCILAQSAQR